MAKSAANAFNWNQHQGLSAEDNLPAHLTSSPNQKFSKFNRQFGPKSHGPGDDANEISSYNDIEPHERLQIQGQIVEVPDEYLESSKYVSSMQQHPLEEQKHN